MKWDTSRGFLNLRFVCTLLSAQVAPAASAAWTRRAAPACSHSAFCIGAVPSLLLRPGKEGALEGIPKRIARKGLAGGALALQGNSSAPPKQESSQEPTLQLNFEGGCVPWEGQGYLTAVWARGGLQPSVLLLALTKLEAASCSLPLCNGLCPRGVVSSARWPPAAWRCRKRPSRGLGSGRPLPCSSRWNSTLGGG